MRWKPLGLLVGTALVTTALAVHADPKSDAILAKAREAVTKAKTLQADLAINVGAPGGQQKMAGTLRVMRPNYAYMKIGSQSAGFEMLLVSTGTDIFTVNPAGKSYQKTAAGTGVETLLSEADGLPVLDAFFAPEKLLANLPHRSAGTKKVDGKTYQVVQVTSKTAPQSQQFFFGESGILEGVEMKMTGGGQTQTVTIWMKNVKVDAPLKADDFAYTPPAGFTVQRSPADSLLAVGTAAPDFQLPQPTGGLLSLSDARKGKKAVLVNFWFHG